MKTAKQGARALKRRVLELLKSADLDSALEEFLKLPARQVVNPLFSFLLSTDEQTRCRAITAMGVVANLAKAEH